MATRAHNWQISRGFVGPLGRVFFRPIFTVKARNQDDAIKRAAHKVRGIALLRATRLEPSASIADIDDNPPASFFLSLELSKKQ